MGSVMRDSIESVLGVLAASKDTSCVDAEGLAILFAMRWAGSYSSKECTFETDCAEAFSWIRSCGGWTFSPRGWVADCSKVLCHNGGWRLSLVRGEANMVADGLARKADKEG